MNAPINRSYCMYGRWRWFTLLFLGLTFVNQIKGQSVSVFVNGKYQASYTPGNLNAPLNLKIGDEIKFQVFGSEEEPEISGVPGVWIARVAGEALYYCTPSVTPGEYNPWIGFDSNVHGSALRQYPEGFQEKVSDWQKRSKQQNSFGGIQQYYEWSWTLQRRMDATKTSYAPAHTWERTKTLPASNALKLPDGSTTVKQRNNQKEGLNIELLRAWGNSNMKNGQFNNYSGQAYVMGLDPDEIVYLDGKDPNTYENPPGQGLLQLEGEPWKYILPGESEVALHDMVTAYIRNRHHYKDGEANYTGSYSGYEIQDIGTCKMHPDGTGSGNNAAPGLIDLTVDGENVPIKLNVSPPLADGVDKGFYSLIEGTRWPAIGEQQVPYTLTELDGIPLEKLDNFLLEMEYLGSVGKRPDKIQKFFRDLSDAQKAAVVSSGRWEERFDLRGNGYYTVTAYYQNGVHAPLVPFAGKELLDIQLRFTAAKTQTFDEGRGDGGYIYARDYRDHLDGDHHFKKFSRYVDKYTRTYTFEKGQEVTFSTLDADPHSFIHSGTEFYLSERTQAKRVTEDYLKENLAYYVDKIDTETGNVIESSIAKANGSKFTYNWPTPGTYQLRVVYRGPELTYLNWTFHKVNVVDYSGDQKGLAKSRKLTEDEKSWLSLSGDEWRLVSVENILSDYEYKTGPRSRNPVDRFGKYNDFAREFTWKTGSDEHSLNEYAAPSQVESWVSSYSIEEYMPKDWVRHYNGDIPQDIDQSNFTTLGAKSGYISSLFSSAPEPWQLRLPWVSITNFDGPRIRTNVKVIYDLKAFFDNESGAFSGNPVVPTAQQTSFKIASDQQKDKLDLYLKLKDGGYIVVREDQSWFQVNNVVHHQNTMVDNLIYEGSAEIEPDLSPVEDAISGLQKITFPSVGSKKYYLIDSDHRCATFSGIGNIRWNTTVGQNSTSYGQCSLVGIISHGNSLGYSLQIGSESSNGYIDVGINPNKIEFTAEGETYQVADYQLQSTDRKHMLQLYSTAGNPENDLVLVSERDGKAAYGYQLVEDNSLIDPLTNITAADLQQQNSPSAGKIVGYTALGVGTTAFLIYATYKNRGRISRLATTGRRVRSLVQYFTEKCSSPPTQEEFRLMENEVSTGVDED